MERVGLSDRNPEKWIVCCNQAKENLISRRFYRQFSVKTYLRLKGMIQ